MKQTYIKYLEKKFELSTVKPTEKKAHQLSGFLFAINYQNICLKKS
jgi:hypothetical protein